MKLFRRREALFLIGTSQDAGEQHLRKICKRQVVLISEKQKDRRDGVASTSVEKFHLPRATACQNSMCQVGLADFTGASPAAWPRRPRPRRLGIA